MKRRAPKPPLPQPLACPFCGCPRTAVFHFAGIHYATCTACDAQGPRRTSREAARLLWDAVDRSAMPVPPSPEFRYLRRKPAEIPATGIVVGRELRAPLSGDLIRSRFRSADGRCTAWGPPMQQSLPDLLTESGQLAPEFEDFTPPAGEE